VKLSVILPTHNPDEGRLHRTLAGLRAQSLPAADWELLLVDNASTRFPSEAFFRDPALPSVTLLREPTLGLTAARRCGLSASRGEFAVLVDDDNVLVPDYLATVLRLFAADPRLGAAGGKSLPEFARPPEPWTEEFFPLLALRDLGDQALIAAFATAGAREYPACAPIGAGMALRRAAWTNWLAASANSPLTDRRGGALTSGGDNEIVLHVLKAGWSVGYFPSLSLIHLIPGGRLEADYLARLNRGIQESWMQVLTRHGVNPWPPLTPLGARLRQLRAWWVHRAWTSPAAHVRWQGACGHFAGRVSSATP
jgi:glycosyltransferase involved in cell wall biosynthesis